MFGAVVRVQQIVDQHGAGFWVAAAVAVAVAVLACTVIWLKRIASVKQSGKTKSAKSITYCAVLLWLFLFVATFSISPTLYLITTAVILSYHYCIGWTSNGSKKGPKHQINVMDGGLYAAIISLVLLVLFIAQTTA